MTTIVESQLVKCHQSGSTWSKPRLASTFSGLLTSIAFALRAGKLREEYLADVELLDRIVRRQIRAKSPRHRRLLGGKRVEVWLSNCYVQNGR